MIGSASREPGGADRVHVRSPYPRSSAPQAPTAVERVHQGVRSAFSGDDLGARELITGSGTGELPDSVEDLLEDVATTDSLSDALRADAWDRVAESRSHHGAEDAAAQALRAALELWPVPHRLRRLADVTLKIDGAGGAAAMLVTGLERWPDDVELKVALALLALDSQEMGHARNLIEDAARTEPADAEVLAALTRLYLLEDDPEAALTPARGVVLTHPSLGRALVTIALHRVGSLADDPGLIEAVLADLPSDVWVVNQFGGVLVDVGRLRDAVPVFGHAIALRPGESEALRRRGLLHYLLGDFASAAVDFDRAAESDDDAWLTAMRGETARSRGDARTAAELLGSLPQDSAPTWVSASLGYTYYALLDIDGARAAFETALRGDPDDVRALCGLGQLTLDHDGDEGAVRCEELLRRALHIDPTGAWPNALLGETMRRTGRLAEAIASFDAALEVSPGYVYAAASKGQALIALGDTAAGTALLVDAAREAPTTAWILEALLDVLQDNDPDNADSVLRQLYKETRHHDGDGLGLITCRARLARRQQRWLDANKHYRKARAMDPEDTGLATEHVEVLQKLNRLNEALEIVDGLRLASPDDTDLAWTWVSLLWQVDRLDDTRAELQRLNEGPTSVPLVWAALGEIHRMEGARAEARRLLELALGDDGQSLDDSTVAYTLASLGALDRDDGIVERARERLRKALDLQPGYGFPFDQLVQLELDEGHADAVVELLGEMWSARADDRELSLGRANALYGLGEYSDAIRVIDDCLLELGDDTDMLLARGRAEVALRQPRRAARDFLASADALAAPSGLLEVVSALCQVDLWREAQELISRAGEQCNPFVDAAGSLLHLHAGHWDDAVRLALRGRQDHPRHHHVALIAATVLRMSGRRSDGLDCAREAVDLAPTSLRAEVELAESLLVAGHDEESLRRFSDLHGRIERRVYPDADDLNIQAWCLLHLGRIKESTSIFLRALSATNQTAKVLLSLVFVSLLDSDLLQAQILVARAREEWRTISEPSARGLIATAARDLSMLEPRLPDVSRPEARRLIESFADEIRGVRGGLEP